MTFNYSISHSVTPSTFWVGMRAFMTYYPTFADAGTFSYFLVAPGPDGNLTFTFHPFWGSNKTLPQLQTLVAPYLADLSKLGIAVVPEFQEYSSLYPAW